MGANARDEGEHGREHAHDHGAGERARQRKGPCTRRGSARTNTPGRTSTARERTGTNTQRGGGGPARNATRMEDEHGEGRARTRRDEGAHRHERAQRGGGGPARDATRMDDEHGKERARTRRDEGAHGHGGNTGVSMHATRREGTNTAREEGPHATRRRAQRGQGEGTCDEARYFIFILYIHLKCENDRSRLVETGLGWLRTGSIQDRS
jgi:hypothetical protein